jgi:hypothetical protein
MNWLTLFREIITVYSENLTKHINMVCGQIAEFYSVEAGSSYS